MSEEDLYWTPDKNDAVPPVSLKASPFRSWLDQPGLTFVIGPGCARVDELDARAVRVVADPMARCFARLDDDDAVSNRTFLALLAVRHGIDMTVTSEDFKRRTDDPDTVLDDLRVELVAVARLATELLTHAMGAAPAPIVDWDELRMPVPAEEVKRTRLFQKIDEALRRLEEVKRICEKKAPASPVVASPQANGVSWWDVRDLFGVENVLTALRNFKSRLDDHLLAGAEVEWLTALLWHSFRYAAPVYPSAHEMAFFLSLDDPDHPGEVPDRPLATQTRPFIPGEEPRLIRLLDLAEQSASLEGFESRKLLYSSLAALLLQGYVNRWTSEHVPLAVLATSADDEGNPFGPAVERVGDSTDVRVEDKTFPVAFVSGFDHFLDHALDDTLRRWRDGDEGLRLRFGSYHLVVPALLHRETRSGGREAKISWLKGTRTDPEAAWTWELLAPRDTSGGMTVGGLPHLNASAPVIVKMNGDPRLDFNKLNVSGLEHGVDVSSIAVLSELQHLTLAAAELDLLNILNESVFANSDRGRRLVLLGEPLDEWSTRQRIFGHATWPLRRSLDQSRDQRNHVDGSTQEPPIDPVSALAINRTTHPVRHSLLTWVRIRPVTGELKDVATMIAARVKKQNEFLRPRVVADAPGAA